MNIVYSQTKQWNPGDELILQGIRNLVPKHHTFIIFNRHPHINFRSRNGDNSYCFGVGDEIIDHVIFAGSPEYQTFPNNDIYDLIKKTNVNFSYIGVGGRQIIDRPFEKATISIGRDTNASKLPNGILLPCPSIFANKKLHLEPKISKERIGFCFQTGVKYICSPHGSAHQTSVRFIEKYKPLVICHSYPDYVESINRGWKSFYSSDFLDYHRIYEQEVDVVVGTRIHGSGWAANYAVPNITIAHDDRYETAQNFGSIISDSNFNNLCEKFETLNCEEQSKNIIKLRKDTLPKYMERMSNIFGIPEWISKELK